MPVKSTDCSRRNTQLETLHDARRRSDGTGLVGIDAPICQDTPLGGLRDGLARAEVCHDALVDLAGQENV